MGSNQENNSKKTNAQLYTFEEDMAIVKYMTTDKRYLLASGIKVWKDAEKLEICPGRYHQSLKERYRKTIVKRLKDYNVDKELIIKITQFMTARNHGKRMIRLKES